MFRLVDFNLLNAFTRQLIVVGKCTATIVHGECGSGADIGSKLSAAISFCYDIVLRYCQHCRNGKPLRVRGWGSIETREWEREKPWGYGVVERCLVLILALSISVSVGCKSLSLFLNISIWWSRDF